VRLRRRGADDSAGAAMQRIWSTPARRNGIVLPAVWLMAGISRSLPGVAMRMMLVNEIKVQPEQQAILGVWSSLPWNFKILAALLSDAVPILGMRRKPYLASGYLLQLLAVVVLAGTPSAVGVIGLLDFLNTCGMVHRLPSPARPTPPPLQPTPPPRRSSSARWPTRSSWRQ
jgi:hypothetical protein